MEQEFDAIIGLMQDKAVQKILDWRFSEDHPLNQCTAEVQEHVKLASKLAGQGRYGEAVEELTKASEKDPLYIGVRVRTMKYLIKDERPLLGLLVGGGVLVLTDDETSRSQVWDMASGVALANFERSQDTKCIAEALNFASAATRLTPEDILSNWNRVEILLLYANKLREEENSEQSRRLINLAKGAAESILESGRHGQSNAARYWPRLVQDATRVFPEDDWWRNKLSQFREIEEKLADELEPDTAPDTVATSETTRIGRFGWEAVRVLTILAVLAWPELSGALPTENLNDGVRPAKEIVESYKATPPTDNSGAGFAGNRLSRVDRDDAELAFTRSILDIYSVRIERDDEELV